MLSSASLEAGLLGDDPPSLPCGQGNPSAGKLLIQSTRRGAELESKFQALTQQFQSTGPTRPTRGGALAPTPLLQLGSEERGLRREENWRDSRSVLPYSCTASKDPTPPPSTA